MLTNRLGSLSSVDRRTFLALGATSLLGACAGSRRRSARENPGSSNARPSTVRSGLPPIRKLTSGPKHHWFGYYDKLEIDSAGRRVLGMAVDFEHRTPRKDDEIEIGYVDLADGDRWHKIGTSTAWGWQQGCMLQWIPGPKSRVLWNDRGDGRYVCRVFDLADGSTRTIPHPVYALCPDGKRAVSADFRRIQELRPGYGYVGLADPARAEMKPENSGIQVVDLESGEARTLVSIAEIAAHEPTASMKDAKHYFNHLLVDPSGERFVFLHRWRPNRGRAGFRTRMFTLGLDGKGLHLLDASGHTSHFIWRDAEHVLAWTRPKGRKPGFWLHRDLSEQLELVGEGVMTKNGHCTYLPGNEWILNDTYPDRERKQHPYLYHVESRRKVPLGHFVSPKAYRGEWRCDTHPRFAPDGKSVIIDSPHGGDGRQLWRIEISGLVG